MLAAAAAGLDVVAITDHDNTGGWAPALAARPAGLTVIRGAEFSTVGPNPEPAGERAPAGLPVRSGASRRSSTSRRGCGQERLHRGMAIVQRMVAAGVPITAEQVMEIAAGAPVGRPHIGRALVDAGVVESVDQAFAMHLAGRGPYYVPKADTDLPTAIAHDHRGRRGQRHRPPARPGRVPRADRRLPRANSPTSGWAASRSTIPTTTRTSGPSCGRSPTGWAC